MPSVCGCFKASESEVSDTTKNHTKTAYEATVADSNTAATATTMPTTTAAAPPADGPGHKLLQQRATWAEKGKPALEKWLAQTPETALEPEVEIVDPHHHLWDMRELCGFNLFGLFKLRRDQCSSQRRA